MNRLTRAAAACVLLLCGAGLLYAQGPKSTSTGVFTEEQAKHGETVYRAQCASCHGADLHSTEPEAPDLTDGPFKYGWHGKTIAEKFDVTRSTMPPKKERSLDDQTYLDIVTYILRFNKIPTGAQKLEPDLQILKQIVISVPSG